MRMIDAAGVDAALSWPRLVDTLRAAFRAGVVQPLRQHYSLGSPEAPVTLLLMPAWTGAGAPTPYAGVKIVTVAPGNPARGLASVLGLYLLMDGATGQPLALLDGPRLTLWRTAAASALAASYLARADAANLLIVGAGALAAYLARAHAAVRPIEAIRVWNRTPANAETLAAGLRAEGFAASATADLDGALGWADIVSAATIASEPLVRGALLKPGAHVDLVGAFTPTMRESDDEAVRRARVFVDVRESAAREGGDIALALQSGALREDGIRADLYGLCRGEHPGRRSTDEITLFKSVGAAIEDLAGGVAVYEAHERGVA